MTRSRLIRILAGASIATLAATALASPAHALTDQPYFSYTNGWRVDRHVRVLGDVNGDDRADVVGFGDAGTYVALGRSDGTFGAPALKVTDFGYAQGWRVDRHPRRVADVDGDGRDDLVGFADAGVLVSYAQPNGSFTAPELEVRNFGYSQGWRVDQHPRELVDLNGNGTADIVGFGHGGVTIAHGRSDRAFDGVDVRIHSFGYAQGWRVDRHPRLLADVDGDDQADIVGFGDAGVWVSYFSQLGDTFTEPELEVRDFGYAQGWRADHPRAVGDTNGDSSADIVGFGYSGTLVAYSRAERTFAPVSLELNDFGYAQGWRIPRHPRTLADINGDRIADLVGFGATGVMAAYGDDNFFFGPETITTHFGADGGWGQDRYPRLLGDVDGDGRDDIVGFGYSATYVELS